VELYPSCKTVGVTIRRQCEKGTVVILQPSGFETPLEPQKNRFFPSIDLVLFLCFVISFHRHYHRHDRLALYTTLFNDERRVTLAMSIFCFPRPTFTVCIIAYFFSLRKSKG
jgi:hypothetical protein